MSNLERILRAASNLEREQHATYLGEETLEILEEAFDSLTDIGTDLSSESGIRKLAILHEINALAHRLSDL